MGEKWFYRVWRSIKRKICNELSGAWLTRDELENALDVATASQADCADFPCGRCKTQSICRRMEVACMLSKKLV